MGFGTLTFLGIIVILIVWVVAVFNKLVTLKNRYVNAFSQIEVQLKRRYDLIPNLIETAKGYLAHERGTLEAVIAARNQAVAGLSAAAKDPGNPRAMEQLGSAEGALGGALGRLNVVMEAYPDLKANQNMMQLSEELTSTENRVAFARQAYNDLGPKDQTKFAVIKRVFHGGWVLVTSLPRVRVKMVFSCFCFNLLQLWTLGVV